jgi:hypothetical protein
MEPFFIFCLALVCYCGYLTVSDLFKDLQIVPSATLNKATAQFKKHKKQVAVRQPTPYRHRVTAARGRTIGSLGQLAAL